MNTLTAHLFQWTALILALLVNPWLLARLLAPRASRSTQALGWGLAVVALNCLIPLALFAAAQPLVPLRLAAAHWVGGLLLLTGVLLRRLPVLPARENGLRPLLWLWVLFVAAVFPWTHLAGIDTYKWQDLATLVQVERTIPWLIHPLSLLGFTPRSYPSAQPLMLASVQMLGDLGVDGGFYVIAALFGAIGLWGAYALGRRLLSEPQHAIWFAAAYISAPVFLRYNDWATGRGLLLALLPAFLWMLLDLPRGRAWLGAVVSALLLAMAHKTGLVAAIAFPVLFLAAQLLPRCRGRGLLLLLTLPFLGLALLMAPGSGSAVSAGRVVSLAWKLTSRFGIMPALAAVALGIHCDGLRDKTARALFLCGLCTLPLACAGEMYGALLALPFVAQAGVAGAIVLETRAPLTFRRPLFLALGVLLAMTAAATILHRSRGATRSDVYQAARWLETYDPAGPFRIEAPGRVAAQMQAYVSGSPRFKLRTDTRRRHVLFRPPPAWQGGVRPSLDAWIAYLREALVLSDTATDWYGENPRVYYVSVDERGTVPAGGALLFQVGGARIFAPRGQAPPARSE